MMGEFGNNRVFAGFNGPPSFSGHRFGANIAFGTALVSTVAWNTFGEKRHMANFSSASRRPAIQFSVNHKAAADSGTHGHTEEILNFAFGFHTVSGPSRDVGVIFNKNRVFQL